MTVLEIYRATIGAFLEEVNTMKIDLIGFDNVYLKFDRLAPYRD